MRTFGLTPASRYVVGRESNVLRVDFRHEPDPPAPIFPGAAAARTDSPVFTDAFAPQPGREERRSIAGRMQP